jgi:hypothetical protein
MKCCLVVVVADITLRGVDRDRLKDAVRLWLGASRIKRFAEWWWTRRKLYHLDLPRGNRREW